MPSLLIKRGTRAQIEAAKAASGLVAGELYLITDESRFAVGTAVNSYADFCKVAELDVKAPIDSPVFSGTCSVGGFTPSTYAFSIGPADGSGVWNSTAGVRAVGQSSAFVLRDTQASPQAWAIGNGTLGGANSGNLAIFDVKGSAYAFAILPTTRRVQINAPASDTGEQLQVNGSAYFSGGADVATGQTYKINNVDVVTPSLVSARLNSVPINYITGRYYDQATRSTASATVAGAAGRLELSPMMVPTNLAVDRMGVNVTTLVASALGRCVVYSSDSLGRPSTRVLYGSADLDFGSTGFKEHTVTFTFQAGVLYWVGIHHSSTATISAIPVAGLHNLGLSASNATNYQTCLRQTITYATGAPASFTFAAANLSSNVIFPSIRFRAA